jgi:hypothetical protein
MKVHTTNYQNTFIAVAEDCPATRGEIPPLKGDARSIARMQFDLVSKNPYQFTSDQVLFEVFAEKNDLPGQGREEARQRFFSKGQPCFRASPLGKRYGWGVHSDEEGKIALYGCETEQYQKLASGKNLTVLKAMRSGR